MNRRTMLRALLFSPLALLPAAKARAMEGCNGDCNWDQRNPDGEPISSCVGGNIPSPHVFDVEIIWSRP